MLIGIFDIAAMLGYLVAFVALLYVAVAAPRGSKAPMWFMVIAMGLMVMVSFSNILEHLEITDALDAYEDYAEVLFLPLVSYGLYGFLITGQGAQIDSAQRAAQSEHHMLLEIVEHLPIGIAIVDEGGRIGYANPSLRELLQLEDDLSVLGYSSPGKVWRSANSAEPPGILTVEPGELLEDEPCVFRTADTQVPLLLSATPLHPEPPHGVSIVMVRRNG